MLMSLAHPIAFDPAVDLFCLSQYDSQSLIIIVPVYHAGHLTYFYSQKTPLC